jgi:2-methylcitrate dehydratase PrpD
MMLRLAREERLAAGDVARIEILVHPRRLPHTDNPWPRTPLEAKFSIQYAVVRALLSGTPRLAHFEGEAALEPEVRRLLALTTAAPHPDMPADGPNHWGAEVVVTLRDGRRLSRRVAQLVGRGGDDPMSREELWAKFRDCAERGALPGANVAPLFDRLLALEAAADVRDVTRLLERPAPTRTDARVPAPPLARPQRDGSRPEAIPRH